MSLDPHPATVPYRGRKVQTSPPRRKDFVPRFLLIVMLAAGLMLGGCAPEDVQTEGAGEKQKAEKAKPKNERPKEEEPRKQGADPEPQNKKAETKKPEVKKRGKEQAPKPEVPSSSASASASAVGNYDATARVSRVVDGDTIEISPAIDGVEDVRLIGVDTPETVDPGEEVEPYGRKASAFVAGKLTGEKVDLEFDIEKTDQYDRLLAYVYADGGMFNEELVAKGYAQAYPYSPNTKYEMRFEEAQREAKARDLGIWDLCLEQQCLLADRGNGIGEGSIKCDLMAEESASPSASASASAPADSSASAAPAGGGAVAPVSEDDCPSNAPIKGNQSGLYHVPGGSYYDVTNPEECFATTQDAEAAGYEASSQ